MKENEQAELTRSVIEKVMANIKDEKTQKDILANAIAEVERGCFWLSGQPTDEMC